MAGSLLSDSDLHGIVDGHIEAERRLDVLKRLAGAPTDRQRVEAWQEQTDMLRKAFLGVEREALPASLDLSPKPRLRCVSSLDAPIAFSAPVTTVPTKGRGRWRWVVLGALVMATVAWVSLMLASGGSTAFAPSLATGPSGSSVDEALRARVLAGLHATGAPGPAASTAAPDLSAAGFALAGVEAQAGEPASLLVHYRDAADGRVLISLARSMDEARAPVRVGDVYLWRNKTTAFAMTGSIAPERLHAIATVLQAGVD